MCNGTGCDLQMPGGTGVGLVGPQQPRRLWHGCLARFSPQIWLSLSRCDNGGGLAGLCCSSSIALTSTVRQLGRMWSSLKVLHLKKA